MLRILHPTNVMREERKEKTQAEISLCAVLLQTNYGRVKHALGKKQQQKNNNLFYILCCRFSPAQSAVSTAVQWKDAEQIEVQAKSRPFFLRAHSQRGFYLWCLPHTAADQT